MISPYHQQVADHYERYPYPDYPFYSMGRWKDLESVDIRNWGLDRKAQDIWIAGCGTIAPLMFGRRNFGARILASDLSTESLRIARRRLRLFGIRNVVLRCEDILESGYRHAFDAIDAYGVIHHTVSPKIVIERLSLALKPGGILRLMIYSDSARAQIEDLRKSVSEKKLSEISEIKKFLREKDVIPSGDLASAAGIADSFLNPIVHIYTHAAARELAESTSNLQIIRSEHTRNHIFYLKRVGS